MGTETAIVAAGCFWGIQDAFDQIPGVTATEVGYIGGRIDSPTYEQVCYERTGHAEGVKVEFDPETVTFNELVHAFFRMHNPTQVNRQGPDVGDQYRSAIFPQSLEQKAAAEDAIAMENASGRHNAPVATAIEPSAPWWPAENYHQKYFQKTGRSSCKI